MDVSLGTGPWGSGGGWSQGWCLSTFENENKPPSRRTPHFNTRAKASGRKKKPSFRCGSLRPNLQGRNWAASQCLPPSPPPGAFAQCPAILTVRCGSQPTPGPYFINKEPGPGERGRLQDAQVGQGRKAAAASGMSWMSPAHLVAQPGRAEGQTVVQELGSHPSSPPLPCLGVCGTALPP